MRNFKLTVEYLGTNYYGWQFLPDKPTVQGEIIRCLETVLRHPVKLIGASRTDAGVHARGQVANFLTAKEVSCEKLLSALNGLLPPDIRVKEVEEVPLEFHARRSARGKLYRYRLFIRDVPSPFEFRRSWYLRRTLSVEPMREATQFLVGTHDFTTFSKSERKREVNPIRTIDKIEITNKEWEEGVLVELLFTGRSFLRHMVRVIVATLVKVGTGEVKPQEVKEMLQAKDRSRAPFLAPPDGLYLERVFYDDYPY
ncbi:tRNA pseudouridine(38-40) synthase TruA [Thermovibrio ammonificans]|uniref:tRNA pseudouridine synthase A n=1 Tax=Thermovibrio ammonificans (strain DSM 15698 / JCM 12110 / HB-1) TaxID=648996 RepID=E8T632_THEA1|nr:tRNA pseudouridine(38-40) synthase TruA [Thermovibrio ammonificans]ADU96616.1 tRNA pseudouridine synthase A [Thermovibrio ammonificans HB-1]